MRSFSAALTTNTLFSWRGRGWASALCGLQQIARPGNRQKAPRLGGRSGLLGAAYATQSDLLAAILCAAVPIPAFIKRPDSALASCGPWAVVIG